MTHAPRPVPGVTRADHLNWAKDRALEYADQGDAARTIGSLRTGLGKHPGTAGHDGILLGALLAMNGHLGTPAEIREFVEGLR